MDRNSVIGFGLLMVLLIGYIFYNQRAETKFLQQKKADSLQMALKNPPVPKAKTDSLQALSGNTADSLGAVQPEQIFTLENDLLKIEFSNKGGLARKAVLKTFKTHDGNPLVLFDGIQNITDFSFLSTDGKRVHTKALDFTGSLSSDGRTLEFQHPDFQLRFSLEPKSYMMGIQAKTNRANASEPLTLEWRSQSMMTEKDRTSQMQYTQVCYNLEQEGYDFYTIKEKENKDLGEAVKWLSFKQHYFNTTLITDRKLITGAKLSSAPAGEADTARKALADFGAVLTLLPGSDINMKMFIGPNDYELLKSYKIELEELIPLSYGIFGFVKYINKWIILPIFDLLSGWFSNFGIVILLLTFIVRLLMSPFTYKSYVSSAKMKALKPEIDELKAKYGDDQQTFGVEQMKLYRQAGVNPLGGCLPALLQLPVFFALLSFFPNAIELRQSGFLWVKDLSTYDSIFNLPFNIPFYGDHVSLFTILFVITSLIMALYSMNMAGDQSNPMMKYLPFIMPVMFLGIFNSLPASLTYYYFVSNVITLGLQFVIQNYIIDPDKIHAQIQAKRNEPPKESKLMKRMQEMQQQNLERSKKQQGKK
jgi:YidC/Oxa1 family membrane protein insertase